jgi:hypothetical protein
MGHLQQAGHDSLADADGEMPAPADVPRVGGQGRNSRQSWNTGDQDQPGTAGQIALTG